MFIGMERDDTQASRKDMLGSELRLGVRVKIDTGRKNLSSTGGRGVLMDSILNVWSICDPSDACIFLFFMILF